MELKSLHYPEYFETIFTTLCSFFGCKNKHLDPACTQHREHPWASKINLVNCAIKMMLIESLQKITNEY